MMIGKITPVVYNKWLKVWKLKLLKQPIKIQVPKVIKPTNKNGY